MDSFQQIALLKIESAQDRTHAVSQEVSRALNKVYASPGSEKILLFVGQAASAVRDALETQKQYCSGDLLSAPELEIRLHRITKIIPTLHLLIGFIQGSDIPQCPAQLIQPLRRYTQSVLPNSEVIVSAKSELNYSIQEIADSLRGLVSGAGNPFIGTSLEVACSQLPELLFVMNIPAVESEQILIHGILSHELGHPLYRKHGLAESLLPKISIRDDLIQSLVQSVSEQGKKDLEPGAELWFRERATAQINERITQWVMELSSDAIGIRLFGPALFFASTHLLTSFSHIDHCSKTHPPSRLRLKLMCKMLKALYPVEEWDTPLKEFLHAWEEVSSGPIAVRQKFDQIAIESIDTDAALTLFQKQAPASFPRRSVTTPSVSSLTLTGCHLSLSSSYLPAKGGPWAMKCRSTSCQLSMRDGMSICADSKRFRVAHMKAAR
ncbi:MAG: hypothetical protein JWQ87_1655 [Candidatus Sulfotelmatobacter sp.]|nr:hypothetical protein [Candidatus Sulfotelmatobacter sp.]